MSLDHLPKGPAAAVATRRDILKTAAATAVFTLGFHIPREAGSQTVSSELNAWIVVHPDERVVIRIARTEMGQGTLTGLAQLAAEELECDWSKVGFELVNPGANKARNRVWGDMSTGGSRGIRQSHQYVREAGAAARVMLIQAAAQGWATPAAECAVDRGVITHRPTGRQVTYGQIAPAANKQAVPSAVPLKDPKSWKIVGTPVKRLDTLDKLDGSLVYGVDFKLPGMLVAVPKACPVHGGKLVNFNANAVAAMPGVRHVLRVDDETVAVVADSFWHAKKALDALPIQWDEGPNSTVSSASIAANIQRGLTGDTPYIGNRSGDARAVLSQAAQVIEADYGTAYQNHAALEPLAATVRWTPQRSDVWAPTQVPEQALGAVVAAAGLPFEACEIHTMRIGGSFGRRLQWDYVTMAVRIARQLPGTAVKMMWTREEDMAQGRFHPLTQCRLRATVNSEGRIDALHMRIAGQSVNFYTKVFPFTATGDPLIFQGLSPAPTPEGHFGYAVPNLLIDYIMINPHVRPGAVRGVNTNQNALYSECFIDEVAHRTGQDPYEFRRQHLERSPKHLAVLDAVAQRADWGRPLAPGVFRGIAQYMGYGSYTAAVAEVSVVNGQVRVHRIVAATDPGHVVNPQLAEAQVTGSFVYGLSQALLGECTVKNGRIEQSNFDTYNVMRLRDMPKVEVMLMPSGGFWGGVGEPTIAVAAPAVLNAVFAATGVRVRKLPLKNTTLSRV